VIGSRHKSRGVSLIEAVVALAVMGFGMLGVAAMQGTLRHNSDVARQRAEAARLGSEAIEALRSYSVVNAAAGKISYADIVSGVAAPQLNLPGTVTGTNATYTRTVQVFDNTAQNRKTVQVLVTWVDRSNTQQEVRLSTEIERSPPELAAALIVPGTGTVTQKPGGRHPTIPPQAVLNTDGTSSFSPPGGGSVVWVFNNGTGVIEKVCNPGCVVGTGRLLAGYINFATLPVQPTWADSESPTEDALPAFTATPPTAGIAISQTAPASPPSSPQCFYEQLPGSPLPAKVIAYYCAIFVNTSTSPGFVWSGQSTLNGLSLATSIGDSSATAFKVCRYTTLYGSAANSTLVGTGTPALTNDDHPFTYDKVDRNLVNQNFLVIRAGDGITPYGCPDDNTSTLVNGRTWHHQPAT